MFVIVQVKDIPTPSPSIFVCSWKMHFRNSPLSPFTLHCQISVLKCIHFIGCIRKYLFLGTEYSKCGTKAKRKTNRICFQVKAACCGQGLNCYNVFVLAFKLWKAIFWVASLSPSEQLGYFDKHDYHPFLPLYQSLMYPRARHLISNSASVQENKTEVALDSCQVGACAWLQMSPLLQLLPPVVSVSKNVLLVTWRD